MSQQENKKPGWGGRLSDPGALRELLGRHGFHFSKSLGQNFLINPSVCPRMAEACVEAGADALSLVNTFQACAIDIERRKPVFNNLFAGLSGPAVKPIALRMVWQAVGAVDVPVIGLGGITTGADALEFIMAGAAAVQVGTANFMDPRAGGRITAEIGQWMDRHGVKNLDEIRGCARG